MTRAERDHIVQQSYDAAHLPEALARGSGCPAWFGFPAGSYGVLPRQAFCDQPRTIGVLADLNDVGDRCVGGRPPAAVGFGSQRKWRSGGCPLGIAALNPVRSSNVRPPSPFTQTSAIARPSAAEVIGSGTSTAPIGKPLMLATVARGTLVNHVSRWGHVPEPRPRADTYDASQAE